MILNPSCSEVVFRLKGQGVGTLYTDSYPNGLLDRFLDYLNGLSKAKRKDAKLQILENDSGGGNRKYVRAVFKLAKQVAMKEVPLKKAKAMEKGMWGGPNAITDD
jgi:hypothetical protein